MRKIGPCWANDITSSGGRAVKVERSRARGRVGEQYLDGPPGTIQLRAVDLFLWLVGGPEEAEWAGALGLDRGRG